MGRGGIPRATTGRRFAPAPALVSGAVAAAPAQAAAAGLGALARAQFLQEEQELKARQRSARLQAQTEILAAGNALAVEFADQLNPNPAEYQEKYDAAVGPILAGITDAAVNEDMSIFAQRTGSNKSAELAIKAQAFERDTRVSNLIENGTQLLAQFGLCETDECRVATAVDITSNIELAKTEGDLTEQAADALILKSGQRMSGAYARAEIARDPLVAIDKLNDPDDPFLQNMDPITRQELLNSAEVKLRQQQAGASAAERARLDAISSDFVERLYTPGHPDGIPELSDVFDSDLGSKTQEHFAKLIIAKSMGADINQTNDALTNELWARVHDVSRFDAITNKAQLVPFIGFGLSRENFDKLTLDLDKINKDPLEKSKNRQWTSTMKSAASTLSGTSFLQNDPAGDISLRDFVISAESIRNQMGREGKSFDEILQAVIKTVPSFNLSFTDRMKINIELEEQRLAIQAELLEGTAQQRRLEGETTEESLIRTRALRARGQ